MLHNMINVLANIHPNHFEVCMYSALLTVGFFGLFCPGELTYSQHSITVDNVHVSANAVVIVLLTSKANKSHVAQCVVIDKQLRQLVQLLKEYLTIRPKKLGHLFIKLDSSPIFAL